MTIRVALSILMLGSLPARAASLEDSLKSFLQTYLASPTPTEWDRTTRYAPAFVDLDGDGKPEVIVYISGRLWCGSGGCRMLILHQDDSSFKVVTRTTITRPPIRVYKITAHGWRNLSVWVAGGGIHPPYQAELRFDGGTYPSNPSVPPARPLNTEDEGKILISGSQEGLPLYP